MSFAFALLTIANADTWKSRFHEDVTLHRGASPVTIQVAWLASDHNGEPPLSPIVVSVHQGKRGARTLLSSNKIGSNQYEPYHELLHDPASGEAFLSINVQEAEAQVSGIWGFEANTPKHLANGYFSVSRGKLQQIDSGTSIGFKVPPGHNPDLPIYRDVTYNPAKWKLTFASWKEQKYLPCDITKVIAGRKVRVLLQEQNFRVGDRKFTFTEEGQLLSNGQNTYGHDYGKEDFLAKPAAEVFRTEIASFDVWMGKKHIQVPKRLWSNLFHPRLEPKYIGIEKAHSRDSIVVWVSGSDGAGSYTAVWTINKSGKCSVQVANGG